MQKLFKMCYISFLFLSDPDVNYIFVNIELSRTLPAPNDRRDLWVQIDINYPDCHPSCYQLQYLGCHTPLPCYLVLVVGSSDTNVSRGNAGSKTSEQPLLWLPVYLGLPPPTVGGNFGLVGKVAYPIPFVPWHPGMFGSSGLISQNLSSL